MGSGRGIGRAFKDNPEKIGLLAFNPLGIPYALYEGKKARAKQEAKRAAAEQSRKAEEARAAERKATLDASLQAEADRRRRQTIFAGGELQQNIFRKTLGSGTGSTTLGG